MLKLYLEAFTPFSCRLFLHVAGIWGAFLNICVVIYYLLTVFMLVYNLLVNNLFYLAFKVVFVQNKISFFQTAPCLEALLYLMYFKLLTSKHDHIFIFYLLVFCSVHLCHDRDSNQRPAALHTGALLQLFQFLICPASQRAQPIRRLDLIQF